MRTLPNPQTEDEVIRARRDRRYAQRDFLAHFSTLRRVRTCGRLPIEREAPVEVCRGDGLAYYRNVQRCGSVHACPVCAPKIKHGRAGEIEQGLRTHFERGGGAYFVTFTMRHRMGLRLALMLEVLSTCFTGLLRGRNWQDDRQAFGIVGTIRSLEFTHGDNGWHPHLHVLILTTAPLDPRVAHVLRERLSLRWRRLLGYAGFEANDRNGTLMVPVLAEEAAMAAYLTKVYDERSIGLEVGRGDLKLARWGNRSPWAILADAVENGDGDDLALWREYEQASRGRRAVQWSQGLRALLLPVEQVEVTDEALAEEAVGGDVIATIRYSAWQAMRKHRGALLAVLRAAERHGEAGVYEALDRYEQPAPASAARALLNLQSG